MSAGPQVSTKRPRNGGADSLDAALLDELASFPGAAVLDSAARQSLAQLFQFLDRDGDGELRAHELHGCWPTVSAELDRGRNGRITAHEFVSSMMRVATERPCPQAASLGSNGLVGAAATHADVAAWLSASLNTSLLAVCAELHALAANHRYEHGAYLGEGAYAIVRRVTDRSTQESFALKLISKATSTAEDVATELAVLRRLGRHRRITGLVDSWDNPDASCLLLDLAIGGQVFDLIGRRGSFSEADAATLVRQLCAALQHVHSIGVAHRDVKPDNILLRQTTASVYDPIDVVLGDFGLACATPCTGCVGTIHYMAPELFFADEPASK